MSSTNIKQAIDYPTHSILKKPLATLHNQRKLPLIEKLTKLFDDLNLENTLIVAAQHLCSTTEILFDALLNLNLRPKNLYVLGKCYSTNPEVLIRLRKKGINALFSSSSFNCNVPFDVDFDRYVDQMLKQIISSNDLSSFEKILILDDGGHLLDRAMTLLPKDLPIVGIEQTSSGFNRLKDKNLAFPVINLARSWLKLEHESPIIIDLTVRKLKEKLSQINNSVKNILLIGYGVLGHKMYEILKENFTISIFDVEKEKSMISQSEFRKRLCEFDLIIGCTGATSLTSEDYAYLKRPVILASISSSDREFEAHKLRKHKPNKSCHANVTVEGITILNSGFPITFDNDYDAIDSDDFQLTRAMILASIYQATNTNLKDSSFIPLDNCLQKIILNEFKCVQTVMGEKLIYKWN